MHLRRDALTAAAEWILAVERIALETPGLVATVGCIQALPGAGNVIPGEVQTKLDVRHADDAVRAAAIAKMNASGGDIASRRNISFELSIVHEHQAAAMDTTLTQTLEQSLRDSGIRPLQLVSGAGHDAAVMARRFPTAMLFIRCRDGISHHPDEAVTLEDITAALIAMWHFVQRLAQTYSQQQGSKQVLG
jgi:allantoate deiminase